MAINNPELTNLVALKKKAEEINLHKDNAIEVIRKGFVDRAIVFIDLVGSTELKIQNKDNPETWILRLKQFSEIITEAIEQTKGKVIKYIGDEVMASFENINDAANLLQRKNEIIENLKIGTGVDTKIKISADFGKVFEFNFSKYPIPDPQGTPVDRCARISKFCPSNEVLASSYFVEKTTSLNWKEIGGIELKGLDGRQLLYQLENATALLIKSITVNEDDYNNLKDHIRSLEIQLAKEKDKNKALIIQIKEFDEKPEVIINEDQDEWEKILLEIKKLLKLINEPNCNPNQYAKFIFLYFANKGLEEYNKFEGNVFNELIQLDLVKSDDNKWFELNIQNRRNDKIIQMLHKLSKQLQDYLETNKRNDDDLFEWSLTDAEFWNKYIIKII